MQSSPALCQRKTERDREGQRDLACKVAQLRNAVCFDVHKRHVGSRVAILTRLPFSSSSGINSYGTGGGSSSIRCCPLSPGVDDERWASWVDNGEVVKSNVGNGAAATPDRFQVGTCEKRATSENRKTHSSSRNWKNDIIAILSSLLMIYVNLCLIVVALWRGAKDVLQLYCKLCRENGCGK